MVGYGKHYQMNKNTVLARIEEIFRLAESENKDLYTAWETYLESEEKEDYDALVQLIHPEGGVVLGMPLAYSPEVSLWRACDVIKKMIAAKETIADWQFATFILKDDTDSRSFLNSYFRTSQKEKMLSGIPSLQNRLQGKKVA